MLFGDRSERNKFANAGVGKNNVDLALPLGNDLVKTIEVGKVCNVSLNSENIGTDGLHSLVELLLATTRYEDVSAFLDKKFCRSQPNPFCPSGDDSGLAFELFVHRRSPLLLLANSNPPSSWVPGSLTCKLEQPVPHWMTEFIRARFAARSARICEANTPRKIGGQR